MLEIVEFSDNPKYYFRNIPKQDNPAYGDTECLMIVPQEPQKPPYYNCGHWDVLHIVPVENPLEKESVTQLGKFWELEDARLFANAYAKDNDEYSIKNKISIRKDNIIDAIMGNPKKEQQ